MQIQSSQTPFQPGAKNTLLGLYRSAVTGKNGSAINNMDSTLNPTIAVQTFGATYFFCGFMQ
jgi:hypothetical protein